MLVPWLYIYGCILGLNDLIIIMQMKSSLGIFSDDLEDLTEGIFKTAYTELGDTNAGTRSEQR